MKDMIAYCGDKCHECKIYLASKNNDIEMKKEFAKQLTEINSEILRTLTKDDINQLIVQGKEFKQNIKPEDIQCDGCKNKDGTIYCFCSNCKIRECCIEQEYETCAHCPKYPCESLEQFINLTKK